MEVLPTDVVSLAVLGFEVWKLGLEYRDRILFIAEPLLVTVDPASTGEVTDIRLVDVDITVTMLGDENCWLVFVPIPRELCACEF